MKSHLGQIPGTFLSKSLILMPAQHQGAGRWFPQPLPGQVNYPRPHLNKKTIVGPEALTWFLIIYF